MNRKYISILTTITAICLVTGAAIAQEPQEAGRDHPRGDHAGDRDRRMEHRGERNAMRPERMIHMMTRRLGLDETQVEQAQNIVSAAKPEFDALREKGRANHEAMRNLDVNDADYGVKLQNLSAESGEVAASSSELRGRIRAEMSAILTPDQLEKMNTAPERRQHGQRRNRGENGPAPEVQ